MDLDDGQNTLRMDELIRKNVALLDKNDPEKEDRPSTSTSGAPGTTSRRAPTPASCSSRTPCATRWWRR
jgi:hypothetical protein